MSAPHKLPGLHFVEYAPEVFLDIRTRAGLSNESYIHSVCQQDFCFIEFTTNSKSGEFFFFTHDAKCMIKTISVKESEALIHMLRQGYADHICSTEGSLLTRIYGLYHIRLPWLRHGRPQIFIVQENVLAVSGDCIRECYDLKGSTAGRTANEGDSVKKDNDWRRRERGCAIHGALRERIVRQHSRDLEFLSNCRVLDYSILLALRNENLPRVIEGLNFKRGPVAKPIIGGATKVTLSAEGLKHVLGPTSTRRASKTSMIIREVQRSSVQRKPASQRLSANSCVSATSSTGSTRTEPMPVLWRRVRQMAFDNPKRHGPFVADDGEGTIIGIIDFLIPWNLKKKFEFFWNGLRCRAARASVLPPQRYARRQVAFMNLIL